ncbi:Oxidoreductase UcpA [Zhongshania aliphaticivorans]|uniref:Oxidoreductase UcpA n=1 Tax=Zhongshania aliphaticivorans TaxID=1470434 RepID=A0A5S9NLS2_9GAMM|nr:SDR family NAD(P)-dependent oxidoreductase [Zhongshania aliphaticivorans]CAA0089975.1 Oxidoreductase UcpA [Zhongshania aliphaticivorans]CAA0097154.1 Oxidoreductase UcpA [Zhongshania aliphaticivorans]
MGKTILITGATDGIGLETAKALVTQGHRILLHGRSEQKLNEVQSMLSQYDKGVVVESYLADLSDLAAVEAFAKKIIEGHSKLDVLINNAGVFKLAKPMTSDKLDTRFAVNTIAPYLLAQRLLPLFSADGRIINLSSAAQASVDLRAMTGERELDDDFTAYAQSKLAITMWSFYLAGVLKASGPAVIAVNPGSMLASKMVKEGFGVSGKDLSIGVEVLCRAALAEEFAAASGKYFDNDAGQFSLPHSDALDSNKVEGLVSCIEAVLLRVLG